MTRGMFVTVLGRMANAPTSGLTAEFDDVEANAYYTGFVAWAAENEIVRGVSESSFAPDAPVTREQVAVMINQYLIVSGTQIPQSEQGAALKDADKISPWAADAVEFMMRAGLMHGRPDGSFDPQAVVTRGEVAVIFQTLMEKTQSA